MMVIILQLLQITHRQWSYRNGSIHLRVKDGMTMHQHELLMRRCEELLWTDPSQLLEEDQALLDIDFTALGSSSAIDRQLWVSEMEAATAAAQYEKLEMRRNRISTRMARQDPVIDTEGSIRFRRRRRRFSGCIGFTVSSISQLDKRSFLLRPRLLLCVVHGKERRGLAYVVLLKCSANLLGGYWILMVIELS